MALYTASSKERVRDAADFLEIVSARTELRRAGPARYEGLCPFHDERTPSFGIDPAQKVYHCFGCGASGDVFTFVQETEGVDFREALELLAERYGVELELEQEDPGEAQRRRHRGRLLELLGRSAAYYERYLWESEEAAQARSYLAGRGLGEATLREFRVGYAPSAWDRMLLASRRAGFSVEELLEAGLAQRSRHGGQPYDRFRSRIMFPLTDLRRRVLGYGARAMSDSQGPKYLNSTDSAVYHKGRNLFGASLARAHAAREGAVILCEGYTDAIALHQAGMRNSVGLMGTALTEEQVGELGRMANTVLLALDADSAGQDAMLRAARVAARRRLELRVVELPPGSDPAELIQRGGPEAMREAISRSVPFVRFRVERVLARGDDSAPEGRDAMLDELRPIFAALPPSAMRMELTKLVSSRLALSDNLAERMLSERRGARVGPPAAARVADAAQAPPRERMVVRPGGEETERAFLALCIACPEDGASALAGIDLEGAFSSALLRRAAERLREGDLGKPLRDPPGREGELERDPQLSSLLAELIVAAGGEEPDAAMLKAQRLQLELLAIDRQIRRARGSGDVAGLARRRAEVKLQFDRANELVLHEAGERARALQAAEAQG